MKNKGITLIALVITIIVLLILAGITINLTIGNQGVITRAQEAAKNYKGSEEKEQIKLAYSTVMTDNKGQGVSREQLENELKKYDDRLTVEDDGDKFKVTFPSGNAYTIDENEKIEKLEKSDISVSLTIKGTPVEEKDIPIPDGFVHVGGSINEGYVISDAPEDEDKGADSDELQGNQFVWVPVDKDQKITAKVESKEDIISIVVTDPYGDKILEESNKGKAYNNEEIEPTINGEYKIKVTTSKGETSKTLEVYSLYAQNFFMTDDLIIDSIFEMLKARLESQGITIEELLEEMDMTKEELIEKFLVEVEGDSGKSLDDFLAMAKSDTKIYQDTENYKTNVNSNGGFYIGRYEVGDLSAKTDRTESSSETGQLVIQKNKYVYNYISYDDALTKSHEYATNVQTDAKSSLLTGAAWDRTLGWLYETGNKTIEELTVDSTNWGNYNYNTFLGTENPKKTGESEKTKAKNIYDLAGNVSEWTTEFENHSNGWLSRDGMTNINGIKSARANLRSYSDSSNQHVMIEIGFRIALYL